MVKLFHISVKNWHFLTLLKTNFLGLFYFIFFFFFLGGGGGGRCHSPIMQLSSGTAIVSKEIICGRLT